jgi:hypothetical protein
MVSASNINRHENSVGQVLEPERSSYILPNPHDHPVTETDGGGTANDEGMPSVTGEKYRKETHRASDIIEFPII